KLCCCVILAVEQVVDLSKELEPAVNLIAPFKFEDNVSRRRSGAQIILTIWLVPVVFISSGERTGESRHAHIHGELRSDLNVVEGFYHMPRRQRNGVSGFVLLTAFQPFSSGCRGFVAAVA